MQGLCFFVVRRGPCLSSTLQGPSEQYLTRLAILQLRVAHSMHLASICKRPRNGLPSSLPPSLVQAHAAALNSHTLILTRGLAQPEWAG
jgi:hypothetical protein